MKRRDTIKTIVAGSIGTGLVVAGCDNIPVVEEQNVKSQDTAYGRTKEEQLVDQKLKETPFFNPHELMTVAVISDLVIPSDSRSGSATDAGVPDFIDFMMKDYPPFQLPVRGGFMWLDHQCNEEYGKVFKECTESQQKKMLDHFADPDNVDPGYEQGVPFFNILRNLAATGFFTSEIGVKDLDYKGNVPNFWDGVPSDILAEHGLEYEAARLSQYVKQQDIGSIPVWNDSGDIIG